MRAAILLVCALLCAVAGAVPLGTSTARTLLAVTPKLYCEMPDSGNKLVGGRMIADINIKVNGRPVNEIIAVCCTACNAAAGKGCRKFWTIYNPDAPVAECQLKTADAKVVPCGPGGCKYSNGKPIETQFTQTASMLPSKCSANPGKPSASVPVPPGRSALVYKAQRVEAKPYKSVQAMTESEALYSACLKVCAADSKCEAFNYTLQNSRCDLINLSGTVSYCTDLNVITGVFKVGGKPPKGL